MVVAEMYALYYTFYCLVFLFPFFEHQMQGETNAVIVKVSRDDEKSAWSKEFTQANHLDLSLYHRIPEYIELRKFQLERSLWVCLCVAC